MHAQEVVNSSNTHSIHIKLDNSHTHETQGILFINQASQNHIGLGHTTLVPNKVHYSLINTIDIINLHIKA